MIMVKISPWGWPNLQYLDMGVAGQKGWETLLYCKTVVKKVQLVSQITIFNFLLGKK